MRRNPPAHLSVGWERFRSPHAIDSTQQKKSAVRDQVAETRQQN
jgi:hypothetical protein